MNLLLPTSDYTPWGIKHSCIFMRMIIIGHDALWTQGFKAVLATFLPWLLFECIEWRISEFRSWVQCVFVHPLSALNPNLSGPVVPAQIEGRLKTLYSFTYFMDLHLAHFSGICCAERGTQTTWGERCRITRGCSCHMLVRCWGDWHLTRMRCKRFHIEFILCTLLIYLCGFLIQCVE